MPNVISPKLTLNIYVCVSLGVCVCGAERCYQQSAIIVIEKNK